MSESKRVLRSSDAHFLKGIQEVVDYRGDVTVVLENGSKFIGYVYNATNAYLDMFPRDSSRKETLKFSDIVEIEFSGEDTAKGKSWEDWMKKKAAAEQASQSPA